MEGNVCAPTSGAQWNTPHGTCSAKPTLHQVPAQVLAPIFQDYLRVGDAKRMREFIIRLWSGVRFTQQAYDAASLSELITKVWAWVYNAIKLPENIMPHQMILLLAGGCTLVGILLFESSPVFFALIELAYESSASELILPLVFHLHLALKGSILLFQPVFAFPILFIKVLARTLISGYSLINNIRQLQPGSLETNARSGPAVIDHKMSVAEIMAHLVRHGCENVTSRINAQNSSEFPISTGGFGDVYRAALLDGSQVGLKCLRILVGTDNEGKKNLKHAAHELYVWSRCNHRNVLRLVGVAQYRDRIAMVSPWMENGDLRGFLSREPHVNRLNICAQIADGVAYLHGMGIVHGDLKAANILVSQNHTPKLTDFGNSKLGAYTLQFTTTTSGPGVSLRWTAPELLEANAKPSYNADVYALGMTILEVITGAVPYHDLSDVVVMRRILEDKHPARPMEHIPSNNKRANLMWSLLTKSWTREPSARPTALEVRNEMWVVIQPPPEPAAQLVAPTAVPAPTGLVRRPSPTQAVWTLDLDAEGLC